MKNYLIRFVAPVGIVLMTALAALAQDDGRSAFFEQMKAAAIGPYESANNIRINCCNDADAALARVVEVVGDEITFEVIDTLKHANAKIGERVTGKHDRTVRGYFDETGRIRPHHHWGDKVVIFFMNGHLRCASFPAMI